MVLLVLLNPELPNANMAFSGRLASAAQVILLLSMVLSSFPVLVPVLKKTMPAEASVEEPLSVQYFTVLLLASLMNRIVEAPAVEEVLVLVIVRLLVVPEAFTRPSMVTLSAPLRLIRGNPAMEPVIVRVPVPVG